MKDAEPIIAKAQAERRRFRRTRIDLPGRLFTPADGQEARCTVTDLSPGGAAIACEMIPPKGTSVILYVDGFGRFEGHVMRLDGEGFGIQFACTQAKRERTAEQLTLFLNKTLVDQSVLRRHERTNHKGFAKFTRADGQIVQGEVMDISVGGVSIKTDVKPMIGEFVLIAQMAGRVARHHDDGIGIEFVGQEKPRQLRPEPVTRLNIDPLNSPSARFANWPSKIPSPAARGQLRLQAPAAQRRGEEGSRPVRTERPEVCAAKYPTIYGSGCSRASAWRWIDRRRLPVG